MEVAYWDAVQLSQLGHDVVIRLAMISKHQPMQLACTHSLRSLQLCLQSGCTPRNNDETDRQYLWSKRKTISMIVHNPRLFVLKLCPTHGFHFHRPYIEVHVGYGFPGMQWLLSSVGVTAFIRTFLRARWLFYIDPSIALHGVMVFLN